MNAEKLAKLQNQVRIGGKGKCSIFRYIKSNHIKTKPIHIKKNRYSPP